MSAGEVGGQQQRVSQPQQQPQSQPQVSEVLKSRASSGTPPAYAGPEPQPQPAQQQQQQLQQQVLRSPQLAAVQEGEHCTAGSGSTASTTTTQGLPRVNSHGLAYDQQHVSLVDDDGASGVGLAAAAAVSAAAARAWASAAKQQKCNSQASSSGQVDGAGGGANGGAQRPAKAGYRVQVSVYRGEAIGVGCTVGL